MKLLVKQKLNIINNFTVREEASESRYLQNSCRREHYHGRTSLYLDSVGKSGNGGRGGKGGKGGKGKGGLKTIKITTINSFTL